MNHHGPDVERFMADRKRALATAGDEAGVAAWRAIADRVDHLRRVPAADDLRH